MMRQAVILLAGALVSAVFARAGWAAPDPAVDAAKSAADASNAFAADLYARLASETTGNLFVSPGRTARPPGSRAGLIRNPEEV